MYEYGCCYVLDAIWVLLDIIWFELDRYYGLS